MSTKEKRMTNEVTLVGILVSISDIVDRGTKGTEVITVRIKQPGQFENNFDIEFINDKIDEVLEYDDQLGARVRIRASLNGRIWQPTVELMGEKKPDPERKPILFLSITGWSIKLDDEPVSTKDRRAKRKHSASSEDHEEPPMPGDDEMPTPEEDKSPKRKSKKSDAGKSPVNEDGMPF